jgi:PAS domain S-box-containing protein
MADTMPVSHFEDPNALKVASTDALPVEASPASEVQFRQFIESLKDYAIITLDAGGHITSWNEGAARIKGYSAHEIVGKHFSVLYPSEDIRQGKPQHQLERAIAEGRSTDDGWRRRKDGSQFWANVVITALRDERGYLRGFAKVTRDDTGRKRTEDALRESAERFRSLFHGVSVGVTLAGPHAECRKCNQAALDLLGVTEDQLLGRTSFDPEWKCINEDGSLCPGQDHPIPRAIATRQPVRNFVMGVYRSRPKDWIWVLVNAEPRLAADGSVSEVVCSFTDITERKRAEEKLRASEERFHKLFAYAATGITLENLDGQFLEVNHAFCELTGYAEQELAGVNYRELTHPEDLLKNAREMRELLAGKIPSFIMEKRYLRKDGGVVWARNSVSLLEDSQREPTRVITLVEDITGQKAAEDELRASEERFRNAFAHAATGMALTDLGGNFLAANQAFCQITGYPEWELVARDFPSITHPDDLTRNMDLMRQILAGTIPSYIIEKRYIHKQGGVVWVRISVSLLRDSKHHPQHLIALVEDITERKQAEESLRELSGRVLQLQDEERRRLARELHESTAQNLAALGMNLGIVDQAAAALDAGARKALSESLALADQCIRELRTFSYLLHPPVLDDLGLSSALAWYIEGFTKRSGIAVKLEIAADLGRLPQELELMLFRIVQESLTNIHHHSGSRTATIRITRYAKEIVMQISDQGHGIAGNLKDGVLSLERVGVGIAGMRERVRQMGGRLEIRSRSSGTDVEVVAPLGGAPD